MAKKRQATAAQIRAVATKLRIADALNRIAAIVSHQYLPDDGGIPKELDLIRKLLGLTTNRDK